MAVVRRGEVDDDRHVNVEAGLHVLQERVRNVDADLPHQEGAGAQVLLLLPRLPPLVAFAPAAARVVVDEVDVLVQICEEKRERLPRVPDQLVRARVFVVPDLEQQPLVEVALAQLLQRHHDRLPITLGHPVELIRLVHLGEDTVDDTRDDEVRVAATGTHSTHEVHRVEVAAADLHHHLVLRAHLGLLRVDDDLSRPKHLLLLRAVPRVLPLHRQLQESLAALVVRHEVQHFHRGRPEAPVLLRAATPLRVVHVELDLLRLVLVRRRERLDKLGVGGAKLRLGLPDDGPLVSVQQRGAHERVNGVYGRYLVQAGTSCLRRTQVATPDVQLDHRRVVPDAVTFAEQLLQLTLLLIVLRPVLQLPCAAHPHCELGATRVRACLPASAAPPLLHSVPLPPRLTQERRWTWREKGCCLGVCVCVLCQ
eukprot:Rhum_TRINITY_DN20796_c0_g1::Rhum_TRINITY_DN20796_c0_g1_i1::g.172170::m.172170